MDESIPPLDSAELRVLGALVEKQITTPEYYPLTLNALTNACNQLTNRDPVVSLDEPLVLCALESLRDKRLATIFTGVGSRAAKYKHTLNDRLLLTPAETALLTVLMLRGPQTIGELRTRAERLFAFDTPAEAEETLNALAAREPQPLVAKLPRQPGTKESRYAQLLSRAVAPAPAESLASATPSAASSPDNDRLARLEQELADLKQQFAEFRQQFE